MKTARPSHHRALALVLSMCAGAAALACEAATRDASEATPSLTQSPPVKGTPPSAEAGSSADAGDGGEAGLAPQVDILADALVADGPVFGVSDSAVFALQGALGSTVPEAILAFPNAMKPALSLAVPPTMPGFSVRHVAASQGTLAWFKGGPASASKLWMSNPDGSGTVELSVDYARAMVVDDASAYSVVRSSSPGSPAPSSAIVAVDRAGTRRTVANLPSACSPYAAARMVQDATSLYVVTECGASPRSEHLFRVGKQTGSVDKLTETALDAEGRGSLTVACVDANQLFVVKDEVMNGPRQLLRLDKNGANLSVWASPAPLVQACDSTSLYWLDDTGPDVRLMSTSKTALSPATVAVIPEPAAPTSDAGLQYDRRRAIAGVAAGRVVVWTEDVVVADRFDMPVSAPGVFRYVSVRP